MMGMVKVIAPEKGKVRFVHQLNGDGTPYAEDVTIEAQEGVDENRVNWTAKDGEVGVLSWSFSKSDTVGDVPFPE